MANEPMNVGNGPLAGVHVPVTVGFPIRPLNPPAPARFATFTTDSFGISNTGSLHNDTDFVYLSANVGANPIVFVSKSMGDVNNGTYSVGLSLEVDIPDDDTAVVFNYLIMNNGHGGNDAKAKAAQGTLNTIAEEIIKHGTITAAAVTVGSFLAPFLASALAAVAGIIAATEAALLISLRPNIVNGNWRRYAPTHTRMKNGPRARHISGQDFTYVTDFATVNGVVFLGKAAVGRPCLTRPPTLLA
jgi:hypothetical protein